MSATLTMFQNNCMRRSTRRFRRTSPVKNESSRVLSVNSRSVSKRHKVWSVTTRSQPPGRNACDARGLKTFEEAGVRTLAVEARKTILLDQGHFLEEAGRLDVAVCAISDEGGNS